MQGGYISKATHTIIMVISIFRHKINNSSQQHYGFYFRMVYIPDVKVSLDPPPAIYYIYY